MELIYCINDSLNINNVYKCFLKKILWLLVILGQQFWSPFNVQQFNFFLPVFTSHHLRL